MRERVKFITHRGVQILFIDLSHATPDEFLAAMNEARGMIAAQPQGSLRTLTNVAGVRFRKELTPSIREFLVHNKPFVRAGAVVGLDALKMIVFNFINRVSGRSLRAVDDQTAAMDWLAGG